MLPNDFNDPAEFDPLEPSNIVLPAWATRQAQSNMYPFPDASSTNVSRLRRVESALQFKRRGRVVLADSNFSSIPVTALTPGDQISLTSGDIAQLGSLPPFVADGLFAATATTTSITWYWDGTNGSTAFVMRRADGSKFTVPKSSLTIASLTANTKYYFYQFWTVMPGYNVGWVGGTDGSPKFAFIAVSNAALAAQSRQDREAMMNGPLSYTTPAAGTSSGPGAGTSCVMQGTVIEPLEDWECSTKIIPETEWVRLTAKNGKILCCTHNHPIYTAYGDRRAAIELSRGDWVTMRDGDRQIEDVERLVQSSTKVQVLMPRGHLFWANDFLSHNAKL